MKRVGAVVPVAVGSGVAAGYGDFIAWRACLALVVALALQIGVNYANDYSDGIRGTDDARVGPVRLVGSRLATPTAVRNAAFLCFSVAALAGLVVLFSFGTALGALMARLAPGMLGPSPADRVAQLERQKDRLVVSFPLAYELREPGAYEGHYPVEIREVVDPQSGLSRREARVDVSKSLGTTNGPAIATAVPVSTATGRASM